MRMNFIDEALNKARSYANEQAESCEKAAATRKSSDPNYQAKKGGAIGGGIVLIILGLLIRFMNEPIVRFISVHIYKPMRHWLNGGFPLGENFKLWSRTTNSILAIAGVVLIIGGIYLILKMVYSLQVDSQTSRLTSLAKDIRIETDGLSSVKESLANGFSSGKFPALKTGKNFEKQINSVLSQRTDANKGTAMLKTVDTICSLAMLVLTALLIWPVCLDVFTGAWSYFEVVALLSLYWFAGYILAITTTRLAAWYTSRIRFAAWGGFMVFQCLLLYRLIRMGATISLDPLHYVAMPDSPLIRGMSMCGQNHAMVLWIVVTFLVTMHMLVTDFAREARSRASGSYVPMTNGTTRGMNRRRVRIVNKITMIVGAFYSLLSAYLVPNLLNNKPGGWVFFFLLVGIGWVIYFSVSMMENRRNTYGTGRCFWLAASMYIAYLALSLTRIYVLTGGAMAGMILIALIPLIIFAIIISML